MDLESLFHNGKRKVKNTLLTMLASSFLFFSACDDPSKFIEPPQKNNPPIITSNPIKEVNENKEYSYQVNAKDNDGDDLTYSLMGEPSWLSISDTTISGTAPDVLKDENSPIRVRVSDGKDYAEQSYTLTVKNVSNTHVLTGQDLNQLSSVQNNSLVFSNPVDFSSQDILVAGTSNITPQGFLREVISLSSDKKTVNTIQATIEQITEDASFSFQRSVYPSEITSFSGKMGISEMKVTKGFNFNIGIKNVILYDKDGRPETTMDQIVLNGDFKFNLDFSLDFDISKGQINRIDFRNIIDAKAEIELDMISSLNFLSHEVKIAKYVFNPIIAYIPPSFPIIIVPELSLYAGVRGELDSPKIRLINKTNLMPQVIYENNQWNQLSNFINDFDFNFSAPTKANFSYKAYIGPRLNLSLYGVAGPYAEANIYAQLVASEEDWKLYGGLEAILGVKAKIFSHTLLSVYKRVIDFKKPLKEGKTTPSIGEKILFTRAQDFNENIYWNKEIYMINQDGYDKKNITNTPSIYEQNPAWSPDGANIIFSYLDYSNESDKEICIMNLDTRNISRLTNNFYNDDFPAWSPDGSKIAFISDRTGDNEIWIMNTDGSNPLNLTQNPNNSDNFPSWSPDGNEIVFGSFPVSETPFDSDIYKINVNTYQITKLTNNAKNNSLPAWSPDGKRIAFSSNRFNSNLGKSGYDIYTMDTNGYDLMNITNDSNERVDTSPSWSPDSTQIVYLSDVPDGYGKPAIYTINLSDYSKTKIVERDENGSPAWSPKK